MLSITDQVGKQVELLEHHPGFLADLLDVLDVVGEVDAVDGDPATIVFLETVDAADHRRLAGAGRADDDDDFLLADSHVDVLERLEVAEVLVDAFELDHRLAGARHLGGIGEHFSVCHRTPTPSFFSNRLLSRDIT